MRKLNEKFEVEVNRSAIRKRKASRSFFVSFESYLTSDEDTTIFDLYNLAKSTIEKYSQPKEKRTNQMDLPMKDYIRLEMDELYSEIKVIYMGLKGDELLIGIKLKKS